jgi:threonine dehydrogenase-like Zn-dependent dehydrogenase
MGAGRVFAVDSIPSRLEMARAQGAEVVNFENEDPTEVLVDATQGIGVDRAIDAVGVDAVHPHRGPAAAKARKEEAEFQREVAEVAPEQHPSGENWRPGDAPSQALSWAVEALAKAGTLSIVGVYPAASRSFPIGTAMNKNLTINMGNCHHRRYIPELLKLVRTGAVDVARLLTQHEPMSSVIEAYRAFDRREPGWLKVKLETGMPSYVPRGIKREAPPAAPI